MTIFTKNDIYYNGVLMKEKLIQEYVNRMNINDVKDFASKNGIILNDEEINLIYNQIVNNWRTIAFGNPRGILDDLKAKINPESYQKIENLYVFFKNRYL